MNKKQVSANMFEGFKLSRQQLRGILVLFVVALLLQITLIFYDFSASSPSVFNSTEVRELSEKIDSLKLLALQKDTLKCHPFNANYLSDYRAYALGISALDADKVRHWRDSGNFFKNHQQFQEVAGLTDSLMAQIKPYLLFPQKKRKFKTIAAAHSGFQQHQKTTFEKRDLNSAAAIDFKRINGIGEVLSNRLVKFRTSLGGFLVPEQVYDVYGLPPEVAQRVLQNFEIKSFPEVKKVKLSEAGVDELASIAYINYELAYRLIDYSRETDEQRQWSDLEKIPGFPSDKIDRIRLYLQLE